MLREFETLKKYRIHASDGEIGHVKDIYFEDKGWPVRYVVVDTGRWLPGRSVLLVPSTIQGFDDANKDLLTQLSKDQVKNSPDIDTDKPVSRQHEERLHSYYGWPFYWGAGILPTTEVPGMHAEEMVTRGGMRAGAGPLADDDEVMNSALAGNQHLRSASEVLSYRLSAVDGPVGDIKDILIEEDNTGWKVRFFKVKTDEALGRREILVDVGTITQLSWVDSVARSAIDLETVRRSPLVHTAHHA